MEAPVGRRQTRTHLACRDTSVPCCALIWVGGLGRSAGPLGRPAGRDQPALGGAWARASGSARWSRILRITGGSRMTATTRIVAPQGQRRGSTSKERRSYCTSPNSSGGLLFHAIGSTAILIRSTCLDPVRLLLDRIVEMVALVVAARRRETARAAPRAQLTGADAQSSHHLDGREHARGEQMLAVVLQLPTIDSRLHTILRALRALRMTSSIRSFNTSSAAEGLTAHSLGGHLEAPGRQPVPYSDMSRRRPRQGISIGTSRCPARTRREVFLAHLPLAVKTPR